MVHDTFLYQTTSRCLPLCLLYPSHPRAFPNLQSFPSNSTPPPEAILSRHTQCPTGVRTCGEPKTFFGAVFLSFYWTKKTGQNVPTVYHLIEKNILLKSHKNLSYLLLQSLVRIKNGFFDLIHLCHWHFNITACYFSPTTTLFVLSLWSITSMCESSRLCTLKWLPVPKNHEKSDWNHPYFIRIRYIGILYKYKIQVRSKSNLL